jgi:hypothetical protein
MAGGFEARLEGAGLVRTAQHCATLRVRPTTWHAWLKRGARLLRDAAVVVALMAIVPIAIVAVRGDRLARIIERTSWNASQRYLSAERVRPLALPTDPSITPMRAGLALNSLLRHRTTVPGFEAIEPDVRRAFSWRATALETDNFGEALPVLFPVPSGLHIREAARRDLNPREREYLHMVATAPVWREFDLVARAPAVDVLGGRFRLPFGERVTAEQRPTPNYADARELAHAALSRAAYHLSIGERDSAETTLRSIVSFGFAVIDNGYDPIDEIVGAQIVGIGRDALHQLYVLERGTPVPVAELYAPERVHGLRTDLGSVSADDVRRWLLDRLADPRASRGERFALARALTLSSCTNVRDMVLGPRAEVLDALERTRRSLPRYASERALMELQTRLPGSASGSIARGPFQTLAVSATSVPGILTGNPRLEACTLLLTGW